MRLAIVIYIFKNLQKVHFIECFFYLIDKTKKPTVSVHIFRVEILGTIRSVDEEVVVPCAHAVFHVKYTMLVKDLLYLK